MKNKLRRYLLKRRMRKKVKRALKPYYQGKKTFIECQSNALISLLGPAWENKEIILVCSHCGMKGKLK